MEQIKKSKWRNHKTMIFFILIISSLFYIADNVLISEKFRYLYFLILCLISFIPKNYEEVNKKGGKIIAIAIWIWIIASWLGVYISQYIVGIILSGIMLIIYILEDPLENKKKKIIAIILMISLTIGLDNYINEHQLVKDIALRQYIRERISKPVGLLTQGDFNKIQRVFIYEPIRNLEGIENLKNLQDVDLSVENIKDFKPLMKVKKLRSLEIDHIKENDLDFLKELKSLLGLELEFDNSYTGVIPIDGLEQLKILRIKNIKIKDFNNFSKLKNLEELEIRDSQIHNLAGIKDIKNLKTLDLCNSKIENMEGVSETKALERIYLSGSEFDHSKKLIHETLKRLDIGNSNIKDISFISELKTLEYLDLSHNDIKDLTPLREMKNLKELNLECNPDLEDLSSIENLGNIYNLNIRFTKAYLKNNKKK
ncbi:leucine-rich repeat domain-containing protein [Crassaminicella profunda]|uniref:leucine-rich repeat domain-containing protein n=1 Tax=Crassaminicella profunda TaxID=1286698 RepID=UPI001CA7934C|nr:leucine-rich repeat domain-containing protein [Crassaminicella profunda]QZY55450.1 leucine-rich repeat domain-containing protein [Crassaminicella profunda]